MRIATSIYAVEAALGEHHEKLAEAFSQDMGRPLAGDNLGWHWVLTELDTPLPKSATALLRSDPVKYLSVALSRKRYSLQLNVKPETGRVWVSEVLPGRIVPKEVALAIQKRAAPSIGAKWAGLMVEIFMPMHQKHPGLAEHAVVGGIRMESGEILCFVSDRPDPILAPLWHVYKFHPSRRVAQALLITVDREAQKDFRATLCGQELCLRDFAGGRLSDAELAEALAGVKKYVWKTDAGQGIAPIPPNARKFKLGEELCSHECKSMPAGAFIGALDAMSKI